MREFTTVLLAIATVSCVTYFSCAYVAAVLDMIGIETQGVQIDD